MAHITHCISRDTEHLSIVFTFLVYMAFILIVKYLKMTKLHVIVHYIRDHVYLKEC